MRIMKKNRKIRKKLNQDVMHFVNNRIKKE